VSAFNFRRLTFVEVEGSVVGDQSAAAGGGFAHIFRQREHINVRLPVVELEIW